MNTPSTNGASTPISINDSLGRKLKILMLHGYTQSGPLFHGKTRALEKALQKAFPASRSSPLYDNYPGGIQLIYPTGPILLHASDLHFLPPSTSGATSTEETEKPADAWGWWTRDATTGEYTGIQRGLETIRQEIVTAGGIDGVIGFSQGGACAALVASLLEPHREDAFTTYLRTHPNALPYPSKWSKLSEDANQKPLKFAISYSGFYAPDERYGAFYEPRIETRLLSVAGGLDSVVEEGRTIGLVERCIGARTVMHPGGHFVPVGREWVGVVGGWIRECCLEEKVEDEEGNGKGEFITSTCL